MPCVGQPDHRNLYSAPRTFGSDGKNFEKGKRKVQIEDTIFWLLFSGILLILAIFPGIAYWAAYLLGFQSPINFVYIVIIFLLLAKQFFMSIRLSQLDSKVRILTQRVALNEEKIEREKLDL